MKHNALFALAALLVACGGATETTEPNATPAESSAEASAETPAPETLATPDPETAPAAEAVERPAIDLGEGWLGVALEGDPAEVVPSGTAAEPERVRVTQVFPQTPAAASAFQAGDVILSFGENALIDVADLIARVRASRPGTTVDFTIQRGEVVLVQPVMLGTRPEFDDLLVSIFLNEPAPPITANGLGDDAAIELASSEVVILDFWATWCFPCRAALPSLNALHGRFSAQGVRVIGISPEEPAVLREFLAETPIDYTVAYDLDEATTHSYYITAYPTVFVLDRTRTVRHIFIGGGQAGELEAAVEALVAEASNQAR